MADQARNAVFAAMRNDPANKWASVSFGILFCLECSGIHRSLGVHISFVRSVTMDSWSEKQLTIMKAGGNAACKAFYKSQGVSDEEFRRLSIKERYESVVGGIYREKLKAAAEGRTFDLAKARASATAEFAAISAPRAQHTPPQPISSVGRSSAALTVAPVHTYSPSTNAPRAQKKNEWEDDWDALLNDGAKPSSGPSTPDPALNRSGSAPRMPEKSPLAGSTGSLPARRVEPARAPDVFSSIEPPRGGGLGNSRDEEAEERLRRLGMADSPAPSRGGAGRDWRDATPPDDGVDGGVGGGAAGGTDYYGALAQGWDSLAKTAVTYGSAAAKIAQDKMSTIDTSSMRSYVQPITNAPVVASVSSYLGSWWSGGEGQPGGGASGAGYQQPQALPQQSLSASGGVAESRAAAAPKEESADWSNWGWGAEAKEKAEPASATKIIGAPAGGSDEWTSWNDDEHSSVKPRRVGKKD